MCRAISSTITIIGYTWYDTETAARMISYTIRQDGQKRYLYRGSDTAAPDLAEIERRASKYNVFKHS